MLPLAALRIAGTDGSPTALVNDAGHARERSVRLGLRTLEALEVADGLAEDDQVLVSGALQAGQRLRVRVLSWQVTQRTNSAIGAAAPDDSAALTNAMGR